MTGLIRRRLQKALLPKGSSAAGFTNPGRCWSKRHAPRKAVENHGIFKRGVGVDR